MEECHKTYRGCPQKKKPNEKMQQIILLIGKI
jgi:hypothetical protein